MSILLGMHALTATLRSGQPPVPTVEEVLHEAILSSQVRKTLRGHSSFVNGVAFSPDGKRLATASGDQTGTDRLDFWADTRIQPGADWFKEIADALATSRVVVLLVSAEFLASDFIRNHELPVILSAVDRGEVILIWLYLSPALYDAGQLAKYQAAHDVTRPLEGLSKVEQRAVLTDIARKIKTAVFM